MNRLSSLWVETPIALYVGRIPVVQILRGALFIAVLLLIWISLQPFADLGNADGGRWRHRTRPTYALFAFLAVLSLALVTHRHAEALRSFVSTPYILFGCWMCINLVMSRDPRPPRRDLCSPSACSWSRQRCCCCRRPPAN